MTTFYVQNFGCRAEQADGASMERQLAARGMAPANRPENASVVVLNTCTVTAAADQLRRKDAVVEQPHGHPVRIRNDVVVREDVAVLAHDEPGAARLTRLIGLRIEAEEIFDTARQTLAALPRRGAIPREVLRLNRDDRWRDVIGNCLERVLRLDERLHLLERRLWRRLR